MKEVVNAILTFFLVANTVCVAMQLITYASAKLSNIIACFLLCAALTVSNRE